LNEAPTSAHLRMSDRASEGSVAESGFDGAFADSLLHDEEVAPLQHVLGVTGPGWGPGARTGEAQSGQYSGAPKVYDLIKL
jgi:hypothetical protein